ncbi:SIS domain-containing protein [Gammaproteobacteria bacterium]|nr:SIS domain-containing protein [Gammaproteobacteria bacterium]
MDNNDRRFLEDYFSRYKTILSSTEQFGDLIAFGDICKKVRENGKKIIFAGNGASASISSHAATDFTQHAHVRSICFNDHNLITAFSNDYGYENWIANALKYYADPGDVVVLISSSGQSENVINAAKQAIEQNLELVTFSGFAANNPLRTLGKINFWANSCAYNIVESVHLTWILAVANLLDQHGDELAFLNKHFLAHQNALFEVNHYEKLCTLRDLCQDVSSNTGKMIFAGNGGSSSIASHAATDFTKQSKIRTICFNDHNLISAFSNDYGQEHWIAQCIENYADQNDAVVLISSSGCSKNVINAINLAKQKGLPTATFTGFDSTNPLRKLGDYNFWVDSHNYNVAEATHAIWICCVVDMLVGNPEYSVS